MGGSLSFSSHVFIKTIALSGLLEGDEITGENQWQLIVKRGDGLQLYFLPLCVHSQGYDCHSSSCHVLLLGLAGTTDTDICL